MKHYKAYCFDLDGTVYRGIEPIPEAVILINQLQKQGIEPYFITNNSSMTQKQVQEKLEGFGIQTQLENIYTSAIAVAQYCRHKFQQANVFMIGEDGLKDALISEGFTIVDENPDVVVMGIDQEVNYEKLSKACLAIRAGATFVATNSDKAIPTERGFLPGNGSIVKLVAYSTGQDPLFVGKPESFMLELIQQRGSYSKEEMVMIGDNYDTDILCGLRFGIDTIHVDGGVTPTAEVLQKEKIPTSLVKTLNEIRI